MPYRVGSPNSTISSYGTLLDRTPASESDTLPTSPDTSFRSTHATRTRTSAFNPARTERSLREICHTVGWDFDEYFGRRDASNVTASTRSASPWADVSEFNWPRPPASTPPPDVVSAWKQRHQANGVGPPQEWAVHSKKKKAQSTPALSQLAVREQEKQSKGWLNKLVPRVFQSRNRVNSDSTICVSHSARRVARLKRPRTQSIKPKPAEGSGLSVSRLVTPRPSLHSSFTASVDEMGRLGYPIRPPTAHPTEHRPSHYRLRSEATAAHTYHYHRRAHTDSEASPRHVYYC
ncbi:hypothetical protein HMN09_00442100 [Mycena chlorophos]|uniref:Uncharacterized protein n=1 Tax=Mycena chlorophos TaxID=658473 RepID=A0A8H6TDY5_MYCCL|nr:hypothetical protein HMN09_00442100 [Mycena chlorophos]